MSESMNMLSDSDFEQISPKELADGLRVSVVSKSEEIRIKTKESLEVSVSWFCSCYFAFIIFWILFFLLKIKNVRMGSAFVNNF